MVPKLGHGREPAGDGGGLCEDVEALQGPCLNACLRRLRHPLAPVRFPPFPAFSPVLLARCFEAAANSIMLSMITTTWTLNSIKLLNYSQLAALLTFFNTRAIHSFSTYYPFIE